MPRREYDYAFFSNLQKLKESDFSEKQLREIYSTFRAIAVKRYGRIRESSLGSLVSDQSFPELRNMPARDLKYELSRLSRYLASPVSTLGGLRKIEEKKRKAREAMGFFIPSHELPAFYEFMKEAERVLGGSAAYDSDKTVEMYDYIANTPNLDRETVLGDFEFFYKKWYKVEKAIESRPESEEWTREKLEQQIDYLQRKKKT